MIRPRGTPSRPATCFSRTHVAKSWHASLMSATSNTSCGAAQSAGWPKSPKTSSGLSRSPFREDSTEFRRELSTLGIFRSASSIRSLTTRAPRPAVQNEYAPVTSSCLIMVRCCSRSSTSLALVGVNPVKAATTRVVPTGRVSGAWRRPGEGVLSSYKRFVGL